MKYSKICFALVGLASHSWGQARVTVEVPANRAWTRTGVFLDPGSTVVIDATGLIEAVSPADTRPLFHRVPPEGRAERQENKPQPTMRALVMLGRIGNGPVFEAGAHTAFTADRSGELQLGINDNNVDDNTGSWNAQVSLRPGTTTTSQQSGTGRTQDNSAPGNGRSQNGARSPNDLGSRGSSVPTQQRPQYQDNTPSRGDLSQQRGATPNGAPRNSNQSNDQTQRDAGNSYNDPERSRYRPEDQYRPDYRSSEYYRRYGHGFGVDEAVRICQQAVLTQATRRFRTTDVHFNRTNIDDNPGRNDWVTGTLDIHRGARGERFRFSCSMNFDTGVLRSADLDSRPLPDDPRGR